MLAAILLLSAVGSGRDGIACRGPEPASAGLAFCFELQRCRSSPAQCRRLSFLQRGRPPRASTLLGPSWKMDRYGWQAPVFSLFMTLPQNTTFVVV